MRFKKFKVTHLCFEPAPESEYFTTENPPNYLVSDVFWWWYQGYMLKLGVGEYIDSDFQRYERVE